MKIAKALAALSIMLFAVTLAPRAQIPWGNAASNAAYAPDGSRIAVSARYRGFAGLIVYDAGGREIARVDLASGIDGLAWSPDSKRLAVRSEAATPPLLIYTLDSGVEPFGPTAEYELRSESTDMLWSPDGSMLTSYFSSYATIWDTSTGRIINQVSTDGFRNSIEDIAWHPLTGELYILDFHNTVLVFDPRSGQQTREPFTFGLPDDTGKLRYISAMALNADGSRMAVAYNDDLQTMQITDTATGESLLTFNAPNPDPDVRVLRWMPDGREIATFGKPSNAVSFWSTETGELTRLYDDLSINYVRSFAISPDGTHMVVVGLTDRPSQSPAGFTEGEGAVSLLPHVAVLVDLTR